MVRSANEHVKNSTEFGVGTNLHVFCENDSDKKIADPGIIRLFEEKVASDIFFIFTYTHGCFTLIEEKVASVIFFYIYIHTRMFYTLQLFSTPHRCVLFLFE